MLRRYAPDDVVDFWRKAGPARWFDKDSDFDRSFRDRFLQAHLDAAGGVLDRWTDTVKGTLALLILLDQYPRNAFRGTPHMYATDAHALRVARRAIHNGMDERVGAAMRLFCYLPFAHAECLAEQRTSVSLNRSLGQPWLTHAEDHRDIIARFGRFPHRNAILGRTSTADEIAFLAGGGFSG
mgnify:CR=1 FL=1